VYLKARYLWNKPGGSGASEAIPCFEQAIAIDPEYAAAYAGLARAHVTCAECYLERPRTALEKAQAAAEHALQLDPLLVDAHIALAEVHRLLRWDTRTARSAYSQAIAINPSHEDAHRCYALMLASIGRHAQAVREANRACELDPLCLLVHTHAAWVHFVGRDYAAAIARCEHALAMDGGYRLARRLLGAAYLQAGRGRDAVRTLEAAANGTGGDAVALAWLVHARASLGERASAAGLLTKLERMARQHYVPPLHIALAYVGLGDADAAFAALDRAADDRDPVLPTIDVDPRFTALRDDARYGELVVRLGL